MGSAIDEVVKKMVEWHDFDIESAEQSSEAGNRSPPHSGLSARPEDLHQHFLGNLGNLQQVHDEHQNWLGQQSGAVEASFDKVAGVLRTDIMLDRFQGARDGEDLIVPLHGCEMSGVKLEMAVVEGLTLLKLSLASREGTAIEQAFALPQGSDLAAATWSAGELRLHLE